MTIGLTEILALYGAVISSILALIQIKSALDAKRFLHVDEEQGFEVHTDNPEWERGYHKFYVSNRGNAPVTIRKAVVYEYTTSGGKHVDCWGVSINEEKCPITLKPGDTIAFEADLKDVGSKAPGAAGIKGKRSGNRVLKLEHSQSSKDFEHKFSIEDT